MRLPPRQIRKARIEIIPMIDTIFFLLVFFMIASLTMIRMRAIAVAVPKNSSASSASASTGAGASGGNLILTMTDRDEYFLGKQRLGMDPAALQTALAARLQAGTTRAVVLNFGKAQTAQALIGVMDVLNRAKTATGRDVPVLIATEPIDQNGRALPSTPPAPTP